MPQIIDLNVARDQVVAFALYTHERGVLKLSAQLYPLLPDEARDVRLLLRLDGVLEVRLMGVRGAVAMRIGGCRDPVRQL